MMVEDNPDDRILVERTLSREHISFETYCVDTQEEFVEGLRAFKPDVILSDHGLPEFNSIEALKIAQQERSIAPFILVTGTVSEEFAVNCIRQGAHDYILKANLTRLPSAIRRAIKERRLELLKSEARRSLRKQNAALLKVNKELDNFVYSVSHNLRAPLTSVMGLLNLAKLEDRSNDLSFLHLQMESSIKKLDETLREILDYSRNVRSEVSFEPVDWSLIIQNAIQRTVYLNRENRVSVQLDVQASIPFYNDSGRIELILNNLLSNSLRYARPGDDAYVRIKIETSAEKAVIIVADNGIGIGKNYLSHVCDMFYRATERSDGAGLGLYIVKEIVSRLDGAMEIDSLENEGTSIKITLPAGTSSGDFNQ